MRYRCKRGEMQNELGLALGVEGEQGVGRKSIARKTSCRIATSVVREQEPFRAL